MPFLSFHSRPLFDTILDRTNISASSGGGSIVDSKKTEGEITQADNKTNRKKYGGIPANAYFIPVVVVLAILNIIVIVLMFSIFSQSSKLSQTTQNSSVYITDATSLLGGTSMLSETSNNYVLKPITSQGEPNVGPLIAYTKELVQTDHRGDQVLARFETYDVSDEVLESIRNAAQSADTLVEMQNHAIALVSAVYPLPPVPELADLELPELSAEEAALSNEEKIELAQNIVLDTSFGTNKNAVSEGVNGAVASIRATSGEQAATTGQSIEVIRTLLMVVSVIIVVFLALAFFLFYRLFISPLGKFSRLIVEDKPLDDKKGLREMRLLAGSFNDLLHRRDALEGILREAAETDTLTGLPNRYSMQQHLLDAGSKGYSLAVFLFDVNNLKITNDTLGHAAGDDLIRRAANCISTCFASTDGSSCYRMAGDEFTALIRGIDEENIPALTQKFEEMQAQNDVSISWGYAYAAEIGETTFRTLMDEADQRMYQMKEEVHRNGMQRPEAPLQAAEERPC